jgi:hypothetical protein
MARTNRAPWRWLALLVFCAGLSSGARAQQVSAAKLADFAAQDAQREAIRKPLATERALAPAGAVSIAAPASSTAPAPIQPAVSADPIATDKTTGSAKPAPRPLKKPIDAQPSPTMVRVPLAVRASAGDDPLKAGAELRVVGGEGTLALDAHGRATLEQKEPGTTIVSSSSAAAIARESVISTQRKTALPWMIVDVPAPREAPRVVRAARPFLQLARATYWDARLGRHIAELWVGLDPEGDSPTGKLAQPIRASLSVSCEEVEPSRLLLDQVGTEGDQLVRVSCSPAQKNAQPRQTLAVRVDRGQLEYPFELARRPGRLMLERSPSAVPGFGIGALKLTLTQVEEDGTPLPSGDDEEIALIAEGGALTPSAITLARGQSSASVLAHVHGVGPMVVRAGSAVVGGRRGSDALAIDRTWPIVFALATLLGGALGGYLAVIRLRASSSKRVRSRMQAGMRALEGMLVGILVVAAVMVMPMIAPLVPEAARASELGWLILAALAGYAGVELFERLVALVFRKNDDKPAAAA